MSDWRALSLLVACALMLQGIVGPAHAARTSNVRNTVHNLSSTGPTDVGVTRTVSSASETEICVFCHTPHGADTSQTPLWNKTLGGATYTPYTSNTLDAETIKGAALDQPMGSSKLCLSCHDGAMALGSVRVLRGVNNPATISVGGTGAGGTMPPGSGTTTGYTRNLGGVSGLDLTNDHPISVTYDSGLANRDGELRAPDASQQSTIIINNGKNPLFGKRAAGQSPNRPVLPLEPTGASGAGQVQCTTCHDPHIKGDANDLANEGNIKFLRRPRVQTVQPTYVNGQAVYGDAGNIMCLACHDKGLQGLGGNSWNYSAHANSQVATQTYLADAANRRQLPTNIQVWQASCLNCHDTHTVTGSRRLLREGTDATPGTAMYLGGFKAGGSSALEETCYQCHRDAATSILSTSTSVPDIRTDFNIANGYRMPIVTGEQGTTNIPTVEAHDPGSGAGFSDGYLGGPVNGVDTTGSACLKITDDKCGADLIERRSLLGTTAANRHVECTDCHNPHRVVKFKLFFGNAGDLSGSGDMQGGTHEHTNTAMTHTNVASGALRGSWGVEPIYSSNSFHATASNFTVRRGDPGSQTVSTTMPLNNAGGTVGGTAFNAMDQMGFVTREYQICLKCHSTYGYTTPPNLRASASRRGLTPSGAGAGNALTQYTDQAKEFQAPDSHANESTGACPGANCVALGTDAGAIGYNNNNHRSWHPVMRSTGRTTAKRGGINASTWRAPWSNAVGTQTMYCSDCHGSDTAAGTVIPRLTDTGTGAGKPWGPHGSENPFILKGTWTKDSGSADATTLLCLKCHDSSVYTNSSDSSNTTTAFCCNSGGTDRHNLHSYHYNKIGSIHCTWCHVAVPHGWKNKALLVNLNDVGQEAGYAAGASNEIAISNSNSYTQPPYYLEAKNKIRTFARARNWQQGDCGSGNVGAPVIGSGNVTGSGQNWMTNMCSSPP